MTMLHQLFILNVIEIDKKLPVQSEKNFLRSKTVSVSIRWKTFLNSEK